MFEVQLQINEGMLDTEYQHLHHADALKLLEKGRLEFLNSIGLPQSELLASDCFLVLSRCDVQFLRELKAEEVRCTVEVSEIMEGSGFILEQQLIKAPKRLAVAADIHLVAMSGKRRRRMELPKPLFDILTSLSVS